MSGASREPRGRDGVSHRNLLLAAAIGVGVMLASSYAALSLIEDLQIDRMAAILLAGVLIVAVATGLVIGVVAGVAGLLLFYTVAGVPFLPQGLLSQQGVLLLLSGCAVVATGAYADQVRRRERAAIALAAAGGTLSRHAGDTGREAFLERTAVNAVDAPTILGELQRTFVCIAVVGAGWAAVQVAGDLAGPAGSVLLRLSAVLIVAGALGSRYGLGAAFFSILAEHAFALGAASAALTSPLGFALEIASFAAIGWGVGRLADGTAQNRRALEAMVAASRELSSGADEAAVRRSLFDSLCRIADGGMVQLSDETGAQVLATPGAPPPATDAAAVQPDARWRTRLLEADGRQVGYVRWALASRSATDPLGDEIAASLIDLGASAIVRARLSVEKQEMEFMARTEHLRTILLDAVSHHFRSPLAGILGSVTSILNLPEQHDRGARRELLLIIKEQANRLNRYVENFLSVARLESGSIDVNISDVGIEGLIYDVWETFGEAGGSRRFLHVKVDDDPVRSDPSLLAQVFGNVLENAIKYSDEGSLVDVRSRKDGGRLIIDVTDQGCGVPASSQGRIFERFFRSNQGKAPGLGLGLYITRSLVEMVGGQVEAHNRADGEAGLTVAISLPLAEAAK